MNGLKEAGSYIVAEPFKRETVVRAHVIQDFATNLIRSHTRDGSGAASRRILGITVIGGLLAATLIAIFLIPAMF